MKIIHPKNPNFSGQVNKPEDHLGLVYKLAGWAKTRFGGGIEEWLGPAYLGLLDAIRTYKSTHRFATHAYATIKWKLSDENHYRKGHKRSNGGFSEIKTGEIFDDALPGPQINPLHYDEHKLPEWWSMLEPREQEIVHLRLLGLNLAQSGRVLGISRERVRQILDLISTKIETFRDSKNLPRLERISRMRGRRPQLKVSILARRSLASARSISERSLATQNPSSVDHESR